MDYDIVGAFRWRALQGCGTKDGFDCEVHVKMKFFQVHKIELRYNGTNQGAWFEGEGP